MITTLVLICHMISLDLVSSSSLQNPECFISIGMLVLIGLDWVLGNPTIFIRLSLVNEKHSVWTYSTVYDMCGDLWRSVLFLPVFCCLWHHDYSCPFCENIKYYSCHCSMGVLFLFCSWVSGIAQPCGSMCVPQLCGTFVSKLFWGKEHCSDEGLKLS